LEGPCRGRPGPEGRRRKGIEIWSDEIVTLPGPTRAKARRFGVSPTGCEQLPCGAIAHVAVLLSSTVSH
jgi:hypothetical protein